MYIFVIHSEKNTEESIFKKIAKKLANKPIGYKLIKTYPGSKPLNYFEPYTTGELSNHSEFWKPVYETDLVLKTQDGINIFDPNTKVFIVIKGNHHMYDTTAKEHKSFASDHFVFSTMEAASHFIKMNAKCLSLQDLVDLNVLRNTEGSILRTSSRGYQLCKAALIKNLFHTKFKK